MWILVSESNNVRNIFNVCLILRRAVIISSESVKNYFKKIFMIMIMSFLLYTNMLKS